MSIGTKSLLYGYHCFFIHPIALAVAWIKLYGCPNDWRIWLAFIVHDWGYWGKPNMDGPEGETHPYFGARLMCLLFDPPPGHPEHLKYYNFMLHHSRFLAKKAGAQPSKLCYADKLAIIIQPTWLQVLLMSLTGEIHEYRKGQAGRTEGEGLTRRQWVNKMKEHLRGWLKSEGLEIYPQTMTVTGFELVMGNQIVISGKRFKITKWKSQTEAVIRPRRWFDILT